MGRFNNLEYLCLTNGSATDRRAAGDTRSRPRLRSRSHSLTTYRQQPHMAIGIHFLNVTLPITILNTINSQNKEEILTLQLLLHRPYHVLSTLVGHRDKISILIIRGNI